MDKNIILRDKIVSILIIFISMVLMAGAIYFIIIKPYQDDLAADTDVVEVMPDIVGYSYEEVKLAYAEYFDIVVEVQEYSDEFPEGAILSHIPAKGMEYLKGKTTVKVTVSRGAKPEETTAVTEITEETDISDPETELVDGPIENPPAEFEKLIPEDEMELTVTGLEIPWGIGDELSEELYGILRRNGADAGYIYYDPQTGGSIEYNADERFSSGSIIKAIYARSILDSGIDLDAEYEMTEELLNSPSELIGGKPVGTMFTARELIEAALVKSDNTAYKMLYNYIGYEKFNKYAAGLGLPQRMNDENYWFRMTVRETATYLKEIYNFTQQHVNGALMLECMTNAEYEMFAAALPDKSVAEKYGYLPQEDYYTFGDCAIVSGDTDYLAVVYFRGIGEEPDTQIFRDVAELTDELHELIHSGKSQEELLQDYMDYLDGLYNWEEDDDVPAEEWEDDEATAEEEYEVTDSE